MISEEIFFSPFCNLKPIYHLIPDLDSKKTGVSSGYGIPSAFLGPTNLWNNANQIGGQGNGEFSLQYMDLDEFLSENGIPSSELNTVNNQCAQSPQEPKLGKLIYFLCIH